MRLRSLARLFVWISIVILLLVTLAGVVGWRSALQDLDRMDAAILLGERANRLGTAVDYVSMLRFDRGVLVEIAADADEVALALGEIEHPAARAGKAHFQEMAFMARELARRDTVHGYRPGGLLAETPEITVLTQMLVHRQGAAEALGMIERDARAAAMQQLASALIFAMLALVTLAVLAVGGFGLVYRRLGSPLGAIMKGIERLGQNRDSSPIPVDSQDELGDLARAFNRMSAQSRRYHASLLESEERFRMLAENVREVFWIFDVHEGSLIYVSPAFEPIWGMPLPPGGMDRETFLDTVHPDDRERVAREVFGDLTRLQNREFRIVRPDGQIRWVEQDPFAVHDDAGAVERLVGVARDVTARVHLQRQLEEAQRLESLGQLTGGVAHDFNNLLTVILGNADLLEDGLRDDPHLRQLATMVGSAAQRGSDLTHRLLAFARKQPLAPVAVDINRLLASIDDLLRRTLGEDVELELARGAGLWPAVVDPAQLESALLNLCLNARDAMTGGGQLTVESANIFINDEYSMRHHGVAPGQYVMVAVSDTGTGIEPDKLERVFEPFFTTKEKGKGSGLGLSMVYGFVKQSGGHVKVYSEPGEGTTVRMYLPRHHGSTGDGRLQVAEPAPQGGPETILLVEDDDMVREYAFSQLQSLGYEVLVAREGGEALDILRSRDDIDLLFTDVVMPGGMSGRQLADRALQTHPGLKVLYTSGYTENAIVHHGRLDPGVQLLAKPYRRAELARRVRAVLAAGSD